MLDVDSIIQCVQEKDRAYGAAGGNYWGIHIEQAGRAKQGPAEWGDTYSHLMLERQVIPLMIDICKRRKIPPILLDVTRLMAGQTAGITTHAILTAWYKKLRKKTAGHMDPGLHYPLAMVVAQTKAGLK